MRPGSRSDVTRSNNFRPSAERSTALEPSSQERSRSEVSLSAGRAPGSAVSPAPRERWTRPSRRGARACPEPISVLSLPLRSTA